MTKSCSGCGKTMSAAPGASLTCEYCGSRIYFDKNASAEASSSVPPQQPYRAATGPTYQQAPPPSYSAPSYQAPPPPRNDYSRGSIPERPKQAGCFIHIILLFCTYGVGNIVFYLWTSHKQREWDDKYGRR